MKLISLIKTLAHKAGFDITRRRAPLYGTERELETFSEIVAANTMLPRERLQSLYEQVRFCEIVQLEGALVECGVWKGGAAGMMALAAGRALGKRSLHLFDAFTDICQPDPDKDGALAVKEAERITAPTGKLEPMLGFYDDVGGHGTREDCRALIEDRIGYPAELVTYHVGWFQDTLPQAVEKLGPIAVLRLDGDWYESTMVCLENLYDLVASGGFVVIDDYGAYDGCRKAVDEFIAKRSIKAFLQEVDGGCRYFVKP